MKKILWLGAMLFSLAQAQILVVENKANNQPLEMATVSSIKPNLFATTDAKGEVDISKFQNVEEIEIRVLGFDNQTVSYKQLMNWNFEIKLKPSEEVLKEIIVTANKAEEQKENVPQTIVTISASEIKTQNYQNMADVLQNSGVVSVQKSQQGGGSPVIRGFEANRVLITVDGVRMNNLIFRAGHLQNVITVDENTVDQVDVLMGPSSTIYGSDALGGVIAIQTIKPRLLSDAEKPFTGNSFARFSSVNKEVKMHTDFNLTKGKFASLTSFTFSQFGDLRMGKNPLGANGNFGTRPAYVETINGVDSIVQNIDSLVQKNSGYKQYDILQKFLYQQNEKVSHGLNFQFSTSSNVPRYDRLTDPSETTVLKHAEWYYGPQTRVLAGYDLNAKEVLNGQNLHFGAYYQNVSESRHNRRFDSQKLNHRYENVQIVNVNLDLNKQLAKGQLRYGIELEADFLKSTAENEDILTGELLPLDTRYPDGKNNMSHADAYVSYTHHLSDKIIITGGGRLGYTILNSNIQDTSFFQLPFTKIQQKNLTYSGSLGAVYKVNKSVRLFTSVSTGFRVPNVDDLSKVFESGAGNLIVPNDKLKPEKTITVDGGFDYKLSDRFTWSTNAYYTWFMDAIVTSNFTYNGVDTIVYNGSTSSIVANQNLGQAFITGVSSQLDAKLFNGLSVYAGASYTYGRIKTDTTNAPLDHIRPIYGRAGIKYQDEHLFLDLYSVFNGRKDIKDYYLNGEDNQQYAPEGGIPAWYTINLKASYSFEKNVTLQAGIENIMDAQFRYFASGINAPGRNVYLALRFKY